MLASFDVACTRVVYLTYVEATVFGVGMNIGCDDCNDDGRTSPGSAIGKRRGEHCAYERTIPYFKKPTRDVHHAIRH